MATIEPIVFLIDDEPAVLTAVSRVLRAAGFQTAIFSSARQFLETHDRAAPGCVVLDLAMPGLSGVELQESLAAQEKVLPIIFLTGRADVATTVRAMKRGAADFLTKPVDDTLLISAVRRALHQNEVVRKQQAELDEVRGHLDTLTPREREVLHLVVTGMLNKQVAAELGTAEKTIKVHRARVMEKMGASSLAELVIIAQRAGILSS